MEFKNQYLTYEEYQQLGGTLEEMPFNILEFKAQKEIDKYTFGRLHDLEEQKLEVKNCISDLMNIIKAYNSVTDNIGISSENTDGYSVSYASVSSENTKSFNASVKNSIKSYLSDCKLDDGTPYLYCGVE